jgi:hypothetical protein
MLKSATSAQLADGSPSIAGAAKKMVATHFTFGYVLTPKWHGVNGLSATFDIFSK